MFAWFVFSLVDVSFTHYAITKIVFMSDLGDFIKALA